MEGTMSITLLDVVLIVLIYLGLCLVCSFIGRALTRLQNRQARESWRSFEAPHKISGSLGQ
jgi:hypothetical protein